MGANPDRTDQADDDFRWWSANETASAIRFDEVSELEILNAAIARIEAFDPLLCSVVIELFERARRLRSGSPDAERRGPFWGVPMLLKDAGEELAGTSHWVGTQGLRRSNHQSLTSTELALRFETLGLVVIGKSACPELSAGSTTEPPGFAPTRNPWDPTRTVGGSSGGSAAAVAAGFVPIAHGSDATGSLRFPASHCGVVTLKPTRGRVPQVPPTGQSDPFRVWTQFALARDVNDLVTLFPLLARDGQPLVTFRNELRVGLLDHDPIVGLPVSPDCVKAVHAVGAAMSALGHDVALAYPPALKDLFRPFWKAMKVIEPLVRQEQLRWMADRLGRSCGPGDLSDDVLALASTGARIEWPIVNEAQETLVEAMRAVPQWWTTGFDLLVTPVMLEPAWKIGESAPERTGMFCAPFSFTGQPALVAPVGVTGGGLPVGVQIVGRHGDDELLLNLGTKLQEVFGWLHRRPHSAL